LLLDDDEVASVRIGDKRNKNTELPTRKRKKATESFNQSRKRRQSPNTSNEMMDDNPSSISIDVSLLAFLKRMDKRSTQQFKRLIVGQQRLDKSMKQLLTIKRRSKRHFVYSR
jgi:hypothetical protein